MSGKLVVNINKTDQYDVDIMRPGKWGNPFRIGVDGPRGLCVQMFERRVKNNVDLRNEIKLYLSGKVLACVCAAKNGLGPDDPLICHGQVYLKCVRGDYDV